MPDLQKNLISLWPLDAKGCWCSSYGGVLNVSEGAILKGETFRGLYRLVGNVKMGGDAGRTSISELSKRQVAGRKQVTLFLWLKVAMTLARIELGKAVDVDFYQGGDCGER